MTDSELQSRGLNLLSLAKTIRHYENALTQANGERFNLFDILHVGHYEVRTHSPMLAELLNPNGSHGQGATFLQLFLTQLRIQDFDAGSARVASEVSIGELGRLDIEITDRNNRRVVVENKIYAGLQEKQLERYHDHDQNAILLFLTLTGELPADWTTNAAYQLKTFKSVFRKVSYETDIIRWLETCRKEVATAPGVREAITQYIHLIQRLTQQNTSVRMNQEIIKTILTDKETYLAFAALRNTNGEVRKVLVAKVNALVESIAQELGLEAENKFLCNREQYEGCFFTTPAMKAQNLKFGIECQQTDYRDFCFGFAYRGPELNSALKIQIEQQFKAVFPTKFESSPAWPACPWWDKHRNWNDETMAAIVSGEFAHELKELICKLAEVGANAVNVSTATIK